MVLTLKDLSDAPGKTQSRGGRNQLSDKLPSLEGYTPVTFFIALVTPCSVFQVRILNVISLCRNNSDGVRPLIPPGFLYLFYHLTNRASYLSLPSSMFELCSAAATTHFSLSCYMPILFCSCV